MAGWKDFLKQAEENRALAEVVDSMMRKGTAGNMLGAITAVTLEEMKMLAEVAKRA